MCVHTYENSGAYPDRGFIYLFIYFPAFGMNMGGFMDKTMERFLKGFLSGYIGAGSIQDRTRKRVTIY